ncbi:IMP cyclohydrolase [Nocardia altamirensis]|uniref:IMP cyclohydrolase n=1 Tax=Nocardia altamirensis TaxID=472158 RepID=UPI00083FF876|nr:IMP cyclohydrolase [Nocardia altamirensis]
MTSEALGFDPFIARYRYPGRGIALGRDVQGIGFAAYWLTGRSAESRDRRILVDADTLAVSDIASAQSDPLRHYTAIVALTDRIVVGNGTQVSEVTADLGQEVTAWEALSKLAYEPDPPILTPRITAIATVAGNEMVDVILCGAVAHPRWPNMAQHNMFHTGHFEPGQSHAMTTYAGDTSVVSTSGQPWAVEIDTVWQELHKRIWANLDPALRVAAAVVPIGGDLRDGRFIGAADPIVHAGTRPSTT